MAKRKGRRGEERREWSDLAAIIGAGKSCMGGEKEREFYRA